MLMGIILTGEDMEGYMTIADIKICENCDRILCALQFEVNTCDKFSSKAINGVEAIIKARMGRFEIDPIAHQELGYLLCGLEEKDGYYKKGGG